MKNGKTQGSSGEARTPAQRSWSPPILEDLPLLQDLTLDTLGAPIGGSGDGSGFGFP